jgi:hypothetical protein
VFCHCHPTCGKKLARKTRLAHYRRTQATSIQPSESSDTTDSIVADMLIHKIKILKMKSNPLPCLLKTRGFEALAVMRRWYSREEIGNVTGYPGVFQSNPCPYPSKPVPASMSAGFRGYGSRVYENPRVPQPARGYASQNDQ